VGGSAVPEMLIGEGAHGTRKAERGGGPRDQHNVERGSTRRRKGEETPLLSTMSSRVCCRGLSGSRQLLVNFWPLVVSTQNNIMQAIARVCNNISIRIHPNIDK
jgi:hypothetical protein